MYFLLFAGFRGGMWDTCFQMDNTSVPPICIEDSVQRTNYYNNKQNSNKLCYIFVLLILLFIFTYCNWPWTHCNYVIATFLMVSLIAFHSASFDIFIFS